VSEAHGGEPVQLLGFSNGGQLAIATLNECREGLIHSAVIMGGAIGPGLAFTGHFTDGYLLGDINRRVFSPEVLFTHSSYYAFHPVEPNGKAVYNGVPCGVMRDAAGDAIDCDFYNPADWQAHRLGLFGDPQRKGDTTLDAESSEHLQAVLEAGKAFRQRLVYREDVRYPPIACLVSRGFPTPRDAQWDTASKSWVFGATTAPGDGRCLVESVMPPEPIAARVFESKRLHFEMQHETERIGEALRYCCEQAEL
jgi:pimeloyl-ACP methyl ester carboxylesterase